MRAQFTCLGVDNLKLFFDAEGELIEHRFLGQAAGDARL
jgi:hypothetical protein